MNISNTYKPIDPIEIHSIQELFSIILDENTAGNKWFRGQADIDYPLLPSVIRRAQILEDQFGRRVKPHPIEVFSTYDESCVIPDEIYINHFMRLMKNKGLYRKPVSSIRFLCLAQHYGVRTKLLDWTTDAIVALFFALDGRKEDKSAGFYILDPIAFNKNMGLEEKIYDIDDIPGQIYHPIAFYGPKTDVRMCRQSGNFIIYGCTPILPIDYFYVAKEFLKRIKIPSSVCLELQSILNGLGITKESIYVIDDEKDTIALEARKLTEEEFDKQLKVWTEEWENDPQKGIQNHLYFDIEL